MIAEIYLEDLETQIRVSDKSVTIRQPPDCGGPADQYHAPCGKELCVDLGQFVRDACLDDKPDHRTLFLRRYFHSASPESGGFVGNRSRRVGFEV
jgi:hypothetical protein